MNPWELLGITPDADEKDIRRAYAAKIKRTRPEADPEAFQKLRRAYEQALSHRKQESRVESDNMWAEAWAPVSDMQTDTQNDPVQDLINRFTANANDFPCYANNDLWEVLLSEMGNLNLWDMNRLSVSLPFVLTGFGCLPSFVCIGLEQRFHWKTQIGRIDSPHPDSLLILLENLFERAVFVRSEDIAELGGTLGYAERFSSVYSLMKEAKYEPALKALRSLFEEDPNHQKVRWLYFHILYLLREWEELLRQMSGISDIHIGITEFPEALLQGKALLCLGNKEQALSVYEGVLAQRPDQKDALRGAAACLFDPDAPDKAMIYCRQLISGKPDEIWVRLAIQYLSAPMPNEEGRYRYIFNEYWDSFRPVFIKLIKCAIIIGICLLSIPLLYLLICLILLLV